MMLQEFIHRRDSMAGGSKVSQALSQYEEDVDGVEEEQVEPTSKPFDINKYKISTSPQVETLSIDGASFDVTIKPLSWSLRNQIISRSLRWDANGSTIFDGDSYARECLKEMIVDAPWGRTTELFLVSIDSRLGTLLETLVPKAFDDNADMGIDTIKKEF